MNYKHAENSVKALTREHLAISLLVHSNSMSNVLSASADEDFGYISVMLNLCCESGLRMYLVVYLIWPLTFEPHLTGVPPLSSRTMGRMPTGSPPLRWSTCGGSVSQWWRGTWWRPWRSLATSGRWYFFLSVLLWGTCGNPFPHFHYMDACAYDYFKCTIEQ